MNYKQGMAFLAACHRFEVNANGAEFETAFGATKGSWLFRLYSGRAKYRLIYFYGLLNLEDAKLINQHIIDNYMEQPEHEQR